MPKVQLLHKDPDFANYRNASWLQRTIARVRACAAFSGDVLIVESEHDDTMPHQVIENYVAGCKFARSVTRRLIKEADHGLTEPTWQRESTAYLVDWLKQRTAV